MMDRAFMESGGSGLGSTCFGSAVGAARGGRQSRGIYERNDRRGRGAADGWASPAEYQPMSSTHLHEQRKGIRSDYALHHTEQVSAGGCCLIGGGMRRIKKLRDGTGRRAIVRDARKVCPKKG